MRVGKKRKMSAIQVAIRIKPLSTAERGGNTRLLSSSTTSSATSLRSPFALDEDKSLEAVPILSPWTIPHEDTVCYDGTVALPDSVRPSGPLSFTFGASFYMPYMANFGVLTFGRFRVWRKRQLDGHLWEIGPAFDCFCRGWDERHNFCLWSNKLGQDVHHAGQWRTCRPHSPSHPRHLHHDP